MYNVHHDYDDYEKRINAAIQMAAESCAMCPCEVEVFAVKASKPSGAKFLKEAADSAYERFCQARETGADVETLRRLGIRFQILATLEEAAKIRARMEDAAA